MSVMVVFLRRRVSASTEHSQINRCFCSGFCYSCRVRECWGWQPPLGIIRCSPIALSCLGPFQLCSDHLQGWRLHNLAGHPVQCLTTLKVKLFLLCLGDVPVIFLTVIFGNSFQGKWLHRITRGWGEAEQPFFSQILLLALLEDWSVIFFRPVLLANHHNFSKIIESGITMTPASSFNTHGCILAGPMDLSVSSLCKCSLTWSS